MIARKSALIIFIQILKRIGAEISDNKINKRNHKKLIIGKG